MSKKTWIAITVVVFAAITHYMYRFQRVGWEGVFPWPKWVLHVPHDGVVTGKLEKAEYYTGDGDMTLEVRPNESFKNIILNNKGEVGGNTDGCIELEVEVRDDAHYASAYLDELKPLVGQEVTAIGVLVDDMEIPPKSELHTVEVVYGLCNSNRLFNSYCLAAATDDSWIQHPPLSDKPTHRIITFPFPKDVTVGTPKYQVTVKQSVATDVKYTITQDGLVMDLLMHSRKDGGPAAYVADIMTFREEP